MQVEKVLNFSNIEAPHNVTANWVLSKLSQEQIMYSYFGEFVPYKKVYNSVFRRDKSASTGFFYGKSGELVYYDIATGENLNCFGFVAKMYGLTYFQAIKKVACDFGLISCRDLPFEKKEINKSVIFDTKSKEEKIIEVIPTKWTDKQLDYWKGYEITKDELTKNGVVPAYKVKINGEYISSHNLRFGYEVKVGNRSYYKIYAPYSEKCKWLDNIPLHIPFGFYTLNLDSDTVYIAKSVKDMIVLKKFFKSVISTQNESEAALNSGMIKFLKEKFEKRIIIFDNDNVGKKNCKRFNSKGFDYWNIPNEYIVEGLKDPSDYIKAYGLEKLKNLFKIKGLL